MPTADATLSVILPEQTDVPFPEVTDVPEDAVRDIAFDDTARIQRKDSPGNSVVAAREPGLLDDLLGFDPLQPIPTEILSCLPIITEYVSYLFPRPTGFVSSMGAEENTATPVRKDFINILHVSVPTI
jgi:hypothetical protein